MSLLRIVSRVNIISMYWCINCTGFPCFMLEDWFMYGIGLCYVLSILSTQKLNYLTLSYNCLGISRLCIWWLALVGDLKFLRRSVDRRISILGYISNWTDWWIVQINMYLRLKVIVLLCVLVGLFFPLRFHLHVFCVMIVLIFSMISLRHSAWSYKRRKH